MVVCENVIIDGEGGYLVQYDDVTIESYEVQGVNGEPCSSWADLADIVCC